MILLTRRLVQLYVGLVLYGASGALQVRAALGLDPWDVLHQGISRRIGVPIGDVVIAVGALVLLLWIPLRQRPGLGTISNVVLVGLTMDLGLALLPHHPAIAVRWIELASGIVLCAVATGMYIGAAFGPGPRDGLMTGLAARTGRSIRLIRTGIELTVLLAGWLLGGQVGVGTVAFALAIGPLTQVFLPLFVLPAAGRDRRAGAPGGSTAQSSSSGSSSGSSSRASQVAKRSTAVSNSGCASTNA